MKSYSCSLVLGIIFVLMPLYIQGVNHQSLQDTFESHSARGYQPQRTVSTFKQALASGFHLETIYTNTGKFLAIGEASFYPTFDKIMRLNGTDYHVGIVGRTVMLHSPKTLGWLPWLSVYDTNASESYKQRIAGFATSGNQLLMMVINGGRSSTFDTKLTLYELQPQLRWKQIGCYNYDIGVANTILGNDKLFSDLPQYQMYLQAALQLSDPAILHTRSQRLDQLVLDSFVCQGTTKIVYYW